MQQYFFFLDYCTTKKKAKNGNWASRSLCEISSQSCHHPRILLSVPQSSMSMFVHFSVAQSSHLSHQEGKTRVKKCQERLLHHSHFSSGKNRKREDTTLEISFHPFFLKVTLFPKCTYFYWCEYFPSLCYNAVKM